MTISTGLKGYFVKKTICKVKEEMQKKKENITKYIYGIFIGFYLSLLSVFSSVV